MRDARVIVVGGGASGIGAAIRLRRAGIEDYVLLEKGDELGGTWRDNTYPGCACDIPSALYSYSFEPNPDWSRVFAPRREIQRYLLRTAERHGVPGRARLGAELLDAAWDDDRRRWTVTTTDGSYQAPVLVFGAGPLHEPTIPDLPGLERFEGTMFHSARWDHDHDLSGERVAVIGTGASACQFVPRIRRDVARLHLFQRTAPWVLPRLDAGIRPVFRRLFRAAPVTQRAWRAGLAAAMEGFTLLARHEAFMRRIQGAALLHLRLSVADRELRRALTPHFTLGCKRVLLSNSYYAALTRPNVELVPSAVREVRARSVVDARGIERPVESIIFGTGFHVTDLPIAERIRGIDGRSLAEVWAGSPQAYLGTTVAGFPNAFMLFGPNVGIASAFTLIESQLDYVVDALLSMERNGLEAVDVRPDVQRRFNEEAQAALAGTVWNAGGCRSYYLDANGRNSTVWPWSVMALRRRLRRFDLDSYATRARRPVEVAA